MTDKNVDKKKAADKPAETGVVMSKEQFDELMGKYDAQGKEIEKLKFAADKSRLQAWEDKQPKEDMKIVLVTMLDKKLVTGWRMVSNDSYVHSSGQIIEDQKVEVLFRGEEEDKKNKRKILYLDWVRQVKKVKAEVIGEDTNTRGSLYYKVRIVEDGDFQGEVMKINTKFLN